MQSNVRLKSVTIFPLNVYEVRNQLSLRDCVLRHVSAYGLKSLVAPLSLKHHSNMDSNDKLIWDAAYDEEYDGLVSLPMWEPKPLQNYLYSPQDPCLPFTLIYLVHFIGFLDDRRSLLVVQLKLKFMLQMIV
jgi:hypothetical protein